MAKKLESTLKNMSLSLLLICSTMAAALGYVYALTKEPIEKAEKQKVIDAIQKVVPRFNNDPNAEMIKVENIELYPAKMDGNLVGVAVKSVTNKGFSGEIVIMAGFKPDGSIYNTEVMKQKETPGLGTKITEAKFKNQFNGKTPGVFKVSVIKDGGEVNAITAATISSRAYCDAILNAYDGYKKHFAGKTNNHSTEQNQGGVQ